MERKTTYKAGLKIAFLGIFMIGIAQVTIGQTSHNVTVTSNVFTPREVTINVGDTVIWTNTQGNHNVNATQSIFTSNPESFGNTVGPGWTFKHVFTLPGTYDYQCDPHTGADMYGKVFVLEVFDTLFLNFTGMTPHVGQDLYMRIVDNATSEEVFRQMGVVEESFMIEAPVLSKGDSYTVQFFSDHNENGSYDAPPVDHAWEIVINDVSGNVTLDFSHNTDFIDIEWQHRLKVSFSGMTPHIGQMLKLFLRDAASAQNLDEIVVSEISDDAFELETYAIENGGSYYVDIFADLSGNGVYDAPPVDHAWRIELSDVVGDVDVDFTHNTDFTDIESTSSVEILFGDKTEISIYPNPSAGQVAIQSDSEMESIDVYSLSGSVVKSFTGLGTSFYELSLEDIAAGVYFFKIRTTTDDHKMVKVVKY